MNAVETAEDSMPRYLMNPLPERERAILERLAAAPRPGYFTLPKRDMPVAVLLHAVDLIVSLPSLSQARITARGRAVLEEATDG
jgi:hypothetical protein